MWTQLNVLLVEKFAFLHSFIHSFILQNEKSNSIFKMNHFVFIHFNVLNIKLASLLSLKPGSWINMNEWKERKEKTWVLSPSPCPFPSTRWKTIKSLFLQFILSILLSKFRECTSSMGTSFSANSFPFTKIMIFLL